MESGLLSVLLLLSLWTNQGMPENCNIQHVKGNLTAALRTCKEMNLELAGVNQTRENINSCDEISKDMFLVNEVKVQTPVLDLLGCYQVRDNIKNTSVSSIPECFAHCHPLKTFGISGPLKLHKDCFCINPSANFVREQSENPTRCRNDKLLSSAYMEVYTSLDDQKKSDEEHFHMNECRIIRRQETIYTSLLSASRVAGYCFYPFCRNSRDLNSVPTRCEYSWDAATQACLNKTNSYLADTIQLSQCHRVSGKIQDVFQTATFWSSRRSYNAVFSVKGNKSWRGVTEVLKCLVVSENEQREVSCNEDNNFVCFHNVSEGEDGHVNGNTATYKFDPSPIIIIVILFTCVLVVVGIAVTFAVRKRNLKNSGEDTNIRSDKPYAEIPTDEDEVQQGNTNESSTEKDNIKHYNDDGATNSKESENSYEMKYSMNRQATESNNGSNSISRISTGEARVGLHLKNVMTE